MIAPAEPPEPPPRERMPKLLRFLALNMAMGAAIGVVFASIVVLLNTGGIKDVINGSKEPYFALALLYIMNALTFASLMMGVAVMRLPYEGTIDMRDPGDRDEDEHRGPL